MACCRACAYSIGDKQERETSAERERGGEREGGRGERERQRKKEKDREREDALMRHLGEVFTTFQGR